MENEKKEYKERKPFDKQIFYFNDKGQLVVESNKGVWVDGEKFVKMYGDFVLQRQDYGRDYPPTQRDCGGGWKAICQF